MNMLLAVNSYAFHWSFPEIVADSIGLYSRRGLKVTWTDATPRSVVDKGSMYADLLSERKTDVYHAAEWACVSRVLKSEDAWIVAKSPPGKGTLNSSFAVYSSRDSAISSPLDLRGKTVAIELGTGAQYTTLLDLENYVDPTSVTLVQTGEPHRRLKALLAGEVDAASMVGPWADVARALGLQLVLRTERKNPTTLVVRKDSDEASQRSFFGGTNDAVDRINSDPSQFGDLYFQRVKRMLDDVGLPDFAGELRKDVLPSRWERWEPYSESEFEGAYRWMVERGLAKGGQDPKGRVMVYPADFFA